VKTKFRTYAYWVATALLVFELCLGGVWDILQVPQVRGDIDRLGCPPYILTILGVWKLLGAIASHLASGFIDAVGLGYAVAMTGVAFASWFLRPSGRRLGSS
jgi:hypothetical protein